MIWGPIWLWRRESQCLMQDHREMCLSPASASSGSKNLCRFITPFNDPVRLVFALGGVENDSHLALLQELGKFLEDDNVRERLLTITSYGELEKLI